MSALAVLLLAFAAAAPAQRDATFVDVTTVSLADGRLEPGKTVVVEGGLITRIGPVSSTRVPPSALRLDGTGRFLMPGLADMHVHLHHPGELALYLAAGVTTVRNMRGQPQHLQWRAETREGRRPGPLVYTSGPTLGGSPLVNPAFVPVDRPEAADPVVRAQKDAGYDYVKVHSRLKPAVYDAIAAAGRRYGIPVVGHFIDAAGLARTLAARQASLEHAADLLPLAGDADGLARDLARAGIRVGTLFTATYVNRPPFDRLDELLRQPPQPYRSPTARERALVAALRAAGVSLLAGTDASLPPMRPGEALALELRFLIEAGLAPHEALRAATGTAGEFVNAHATDRQRFGELVPGARADLLLLSADPLQDVSRAFAPVGVMAAGRWYSELDLRSLRAEAAAVVPKQRRRRARAALRTDRSKPERRCLRPAAF